MKKVFILITLLLVSCKSCPKTVKKQPCTTANSHMNQTKPLLGVPFGKVVLVEGFFYNGDKTKTKALTGVILMEVHKIDKEPLKKPVRIRFQNSKNLFKNPKDGDKFSVYAYESGHFTGVPEKAFKYIPMVTTSSFHFETFLIPLALSRLK